MQPNNDYVPVIRESAVTEVFNRYFPRFMLSPMQKSFLSFVECSMINYNKWILNRAIAFDRLFHDFSSFDFYPGRQMGISTILSILPEVDFTNKMYSTKILTRNHQSLGVSNYRELKAAMPDSITSIRSYITMKDINAGIMPHKEIVFVDTSRSEFLKIAKIGPKTKDFSDFMQKYHVALIYFVGI